MLWVLNQVCLLFWLRLLHCEAAHPRGRDASREFLVEEPLAHLDDRTAGVSGCPSGNGSVVGVGGISAVEDKQPIAILTRNRKVCRGPARLRNHGGPNGI